MFSLLNSTIVLSHFSKCFLTWSTFWVADGHFPNEDSKYNRWLLELCMYDLPFWELSLSSQHWVLLVKWLVSCSSFSIFLTCLTIFYCRLYFRFREIEEVFLNCWLWWYPNFYTPRSRVHGICSIWIGLQAKMVSKYVHDKLVKLTFWMIG